MVVSRIAFVGVGILFVLAMPAGAQNLCPTPLGAEEPDPTYQPSVTEPTYPHKYNSFGQTGAALRVAVDATHNNLHTVGPPNCLFYPFAQALRADGVVVEDFHVPFDATTCTLPDVTGPYSPSVGRQACAYYQALQQFDVLVIANPQTAISAAEAELILRWLGGGNLIGTMEGLLLIADYKSGLDLPSKVYELSSRLGLVWSNSSEPVHLFVPADPSYRLDATSPTTRGLKAREDVASVKTFGGSRLTRAASSWFEDESILSLPSPAQSSQGWAFRAGGRVYASADAEMFTAIRNVPVPGGSLNRRGMQVHPENEKFLLDTVHWLGDLCGSYGLSGLDAAEYLSPWASNGNPPNLAFEPQVDTPTYANGLGPRIAVDHTHGDWQTIGLPSCKYLPFAQLLRADGAVVEEFDTPFDEIFCGDLQNLAGCAYVDALRSVDILAIVSPMQPISAAEAAVIDAWVRGEIACEDGCEGRGLLLFSDHDPYPQWTEALASRFGFSWPTAFNGWSDILFAPGSAYHLNTAHPTTQGFDSTDTVHSVIAFGPSSFNEITPGTLSGASILDLPPSVGQSVGWAFHWGAGRVYASGDSSMFTALLGNSLMGVNGQYGMGAHPENQKFLLNIIHWIDGMLPANSLQIDDFEVGPLAFQDYRVSAGIGASSTSSEQQGLDPVHVVGGVRLVTLTSEPSLVTSAALSPTEGSDDSLFVESVGRGLVDLVYDGIAGDATASGSSGALVLNLGSYDELVFDVAALDGDMTYLEVRLSDSTGSAHHFNGPVVLGPNVVPLSTFSGVDLTNIRQIRFRLTQSTYGSVATTGYSIRVRDISAVQD